MRQKTVGIIGGMGPEATVDIMQRIIQATPANDDQDHLRLLVDNNPKVPSRIRALIEGTGEDPAPVLVQMARDLERWGGRLSGHTLQHCAPFPPGGSGSSRRPGLEHDRAYCRTDSAGNPRCPQGRASRIHGRDPNGSLRQILRSQGRGGGPPRRHVSRPSPCRYSRDQSPEVQFRLLGRP